MYCVSWSDDTGEHKKDKKKKRPIGKVQVGGVGPQAPHHISRLSLSLAGCTWLSGKQTKAKPSSASYSPVSFYTFLFILQSYLCTSNHPQSTKFPSFYVQKFLSFYLGSGFDLSLWIYCRFWTFIPLSSLPLSPASKLFIFLFIY
jgi:hypothetical protein